MRKLVYKCFTNNLYIKTVATYKEAIEWKQLHKRNSFRDEVEEMKTEETEKARKIRLERIEKRRKAIRKAG